MRGGLLNLRIVPEAPQPLDLWFAAEPGHLAFGVVAVSLLSGLQGLLAREFSAQDLHCLLVAEGSQRSGGIAVLFKQRLRLINPASVEHRLRAAVHSGIKNLTIGIQTEAQDAEAEQ